MPIVIGFGGQKRNGKDVAADYLCSRLNELGAFGTWGRGSLGHNVKKIFSEHFGVSLDFIEEWKTKDEAPPGFSGPVRMGLTAIGDAWRNTKEDIWISKLFKEHTDNLQLNRGTTMNLVISDIRYINETKACRGESDLPYMKDYVGATALIWRPGYENDKPTKSEQELMPFVRKLKGVYSGVIVDPEIPFDLWLVNDGTKEDWLDKVDTIVIPYVLQKFTTV